ncbi:MAG TPA: DUF882 domain-containing protein [Kofleriaceae bacterium]|nr:DUF882 domain-containing protein [Kofleriaceae bacterium]
MQPRKLLVLGAIALGVLTGPLASETFGTPSAEARPAKAAKPAKAPRGARAKGPKTAREARGKGRAGRATSVRERADGESAGRHHRDKGRMRMCHDVVTGSGRHKRTRKRCGFIKVFSGHGVAQSELRTAPLDRPSGDVWVYAENLNEEQRVNIYRPDGQFDEDALAKLDVIFRCKRTQEVRALDPRLYEQLSRMEDHFGKVRATVISGFRFAERSSSRHYHASAIDIRLDGVGLRDMYDYAQTLDLGGMGMGIYPHSNFIHVDYRAPGEPSYRWTDYSGAGSSEAARRGAHKLPGRTARAHRPTS